MLTFTALVALLAMAPASPPPPSQPNVLAMRPDGVDAARLDPPLRDSLTGLVAVALESGDGYEVTAVREGASWELKLTVVGKGPWRLSAQLDPIAPGASSRRISTKKHPFTGRGDLVGAVDALVAELDGGIRSQAGQPAAAPDAPAPLARVLSSSSSAVDAYLEGLSLSRSANTGRARESYGKALALDPSFCLAAVDSAYLDITSGSAASARSLMEKTTARGKCPTASIESVARGFEMLSRGDTEGAVTSAARILERAPHSRRGHLLHALALSTGGRARETVDEWRALVGAEPSDAAGQMWLGLVLMMTGDFPAAADAFGKARAGWPELLRAYTLQAEAQARRGEPALARAALTDMKSFMTARGIVPDDDQRNPDLMLGAVELLEGHTVAALRKFEAALDTLEKAGAKADVVDTLHNAVIEMRRDLIVSNDPVKRRREISDAREAINRYEASQTEEHRRTSPWELLRLRGLISVREGKTVDAWKTVDEIKSHSREPGYSEYYEAYLTAAILLKEGDDKGSAAQFERAAKARGKIVDLIDLAQMQGDIRSYADSRATYEEISRRLDQYDPTPGPDPGPMGELVVIDPHLSAMIPIYHYTWGRLAFETNEPAESRRHFNRLLKYLKDPDAELMPLVKEAYGRGATPE
ncbi:MAG TPA: hypothetical protein VFE84_08660 [Patescibacteria group bacterium]|nr:hypothetical protein [Patescibacteria group bacterium]